MKSFVYPASPVHQREKEKERDSGDSMASSKRRKVVKDVENRCFKDEWMEKCMYILPADSSKPVCLICSNNNQKKKRKKKKKVFEVMRHNLDFMRFRPFHEGHFSNWTSVTFN